MKKFIFSLILFGFISVKVTAQESLIWHTDFNKALEIALNEDKKVMLFFTGSDWCGWCIKLQNEVFKTPDFKEWSDDIVLVELDFPRRTPQDDKIKGQNRQLQAMFKVRGYPSVYFVQPQKMPDGRMNLNTLGKTGYVKGGASKWLEVANSIVNKTI
jgi:protein disulfide-isomerase